MEKHLRAVIDEHLGKARSATTMEEMKAEYEEAITGILNAYRAVLAIVKVGLIPALSEHRVKTGRKTRNRTDKAVAAAN
jgi:hypothetical protein